MADELIEETEILSESSTEETALEAQPQQAAETKFEEQPQQAKEEPKEEPRVPLSRLREERQKRREIEEKLREFSEKGRADASSQQETSSEQEAEAYLRRLTEKVLTEREQQTQAQEAKEDEEFEEMLSEFESLDKDFDRKRFVNLVVKYKPEDEDAAWNLWQDFKGKPQQESPKPKIPSGEKTTDAVVEKDYSSDKSKPLWQVLDEAKREHGLKK